MRHYYTQILPMMLLPSTFVGFITGMCETIKSREISPIDMFSNWIGYTSIGIMTGISYPVSFPMLAGYVIYKNY